MDPLRRDLDATKIRIETLLAEGKRVTSRTPAARNPKLIFAGFLDRLRAIRVLDPACGSGNFLYVALRSLKDLHAWAFGDEHLVARDTGVKLRPTADVPGVASRRAVRQRSERDAVAGSVERLRQIERSG